MRTLILLAALLCRTPQVHADENDYERRGNYITNIQNVVQALAEKRWDDAVRFATAAQKLFPDDPVCVKLLDDVRAAKDKAGADPTSRGKAGTDTPGKDTGTTTPPATPVVVNVPPAPAPIILPALPASWQTFLNSVLAIIGVIGTIWAGYLQMTKHNAGTPIVLAPPASAPLPSAAQELASAQAEIAILRDLLKTHRPS